MPEGPLGFVDVDRDRELGEKMQLGVSGTSFPNIRKSPMNVLFVLDTHVATLPSDINNTTLKEKIQDKFKGTPRVTAERGGPTSSKPFENQAIVVKLKPDSLPLQDPSLHLAEESINRHYSDFGAEVSGIIMDTE